MVKKNLDLYVYTLITSNLYSMLGIDDTEFRRLRREVWKKD